ncbi:MAG: GTP-binding protein [Verrucomicrobiota bacterium]
MSSFTNYPIKPRYIMIGGFLGAGKTTSILALGQHLRDQGKTVGLITNDQGQGLVDTALGKAGHFPVEEIAGGCFCCRFSSLVDAAKNLTAETRPDFLLAEPVGSCTDLVATVALPLQQIYGSRFAISPLSVVVDPLRARAILGLDKKKSFSKNVTYIYRKQLEEARNIVVNKTDIVDATQLGELVDALQAEFKGAQVFTISAREKQNLDSWFDSVLTEEFDPTEVLDIDYETYGDGEAKLGWLNATLSMDAGEEVDGNEFLMNFCRSLHATLKGEAVEVAHLKMTLAPEDDPFEIAALNLVRTDGAPEMSHTLLDPVENAEISVNLRAEADPEVLIEALRKTIDDTVRDGYGLILEIKHQEHFRPSMPTPEHRLEIAT